MNFQPGISNERRLAAILKPTSPHAKSHEALLSPIDSLAFATEDMAAARGSAAVKREVACATLPRSEASEVMAEHCHQTWPTDFLFHNLLIE